MENSCTSCGRKFSYRANLQRHLQKHCNKCYLCPITFDNYEDVRRHERGHLSGYKVNTVTLNCSECGFECNGYSQLYHHNIQAHPNVQAGAGNIIHNPPVDKVSDRSAIDKRVNQQFIFPNVEDKYDILTFFVNVKEEIKLHLEEQQDELGQIRWYLDI